LKKIFVNQNHQLRSGWKISIVISIFLIFGLLLAIITHLIFRDQNNPVFQFVEQLITAISLILSTYFVTRVIDQKKVAAIGLSSLKKGFSELLFGLVFGASLMTVIFLQLLFSGNISLTGFFEPGFLYSAGTVLIILTAAGFAEEFFGRGYCMTALWQTGNLWITIAGSSLLFSLFHIFNPHVTLVALINIFLAGFLAAYMFFKTGSLWMPVGFHIAWNYFQGVVFGFPISGIQFNSIIKIKILHDNTLTGGPFGPEGGLIATVIMLIGLVTLKIYIGNREPPHCRNSFKQGR
jgi:uncharacterized protein